MALLHGLLFPCIKVSAQSTTISSCSQKPPCVLSPTTVHFTHRCALRCNLAALPRHLSFHYYVQSKHCSHFFCHNLQNQFAILENAEWWKDPLLESYRLIHPYLKVCTQLAHLYTLLLFSRVVSLDLNSEEGINWGTLPDDGWKIWTSHKL